MPASASNPSAAFDRLHPAVQRWIYDQGWAELRSVQVSAIEAILPGDADVVIAASTAAGKTEAAFLPTLSRTADALRSAVAVVYVSPLKALINDQYRRLELLCERLDVEAVKWHGDAPQGPKRRVLKSPKGVVLITPESLEAMLVRRPGDAQRLFAGLQAVVIDELHAFLQGPRGLQLGSLLRRLDALIGRRAQRIALSATLGDLSVAVRWLHSEAPDSVRVVQGGGSPEVRLQIRGYVEPPDDDQPDDLESGEGEPKALDMIADHQFATLRGKNNLVFGGSRRTVEALADRLRRRSEAANVPNEFFPHHGSLSKSLREDLEARLKQGTLPTTAIATSTLELGVDIGSVASVALVGAPRSLSSLRQRLGRSGRREGTPAILRIYVREKNLAADADPLDRLRPNIARSVAAVRLLAGRFVEAPRQDGALATAVLHQTLALLTQRGALRPDVAFRALCGGGPLGAFQTGDYVQLLRGMASTTPPLLEQGPDGALMLGPLGEEIAQGRDFYALFETDQEWRLVHDGRALGTIPLSNLLSVGGLLGFAGRRWRVASVDDRAKVLEVVPHPAGRLPKFERLYGEPLHDRLAGETREVYLADDIPSFVDENAAHLLSEGRRAFAELDLAQRSLIPAGRDCHVLTWRGTILNGCLAIALSATGLGCEPHDLGVTVADCSAAQLRAVLQRLRPLPSAEELSGFVENLSTAKYDELVPEDLLRRLWARANADVVALLPGLIEEILANSGVD